MMHFCVKMLLEEFSVELEPRMDKSERNISRMWPRSKPCSETCRVVLQSTSQVFSRELRTYAQCRLGWS